MDAKKLVKQFNEWTPVEAIAKGRIKTAEELRAVFQAAIEAVAYHRLGYDPHGSFDADRMLVLMDRLGDALDDFFNADIQPVTMQYQTDTPKDGNIIEK